MLDYVPHSDTDLLAWAANLVEYVSAHLTELGIGGDDIAPVAMDLADFFEKVNDNIAAQQIAEMQRQKKEDSRHTLEFAIKRLVRHLKELGDIDGRLIRLAPGIFEKVSS